SNGFIDILTLAVSTPVWSTLTRTLTSLSTTRLTATSAFISPSLGKTRRTARHYARAQPDDKAPFTGVTSPKTASRRNPGSTVQPPRCRLGGSRLSPGRRLEPRLQPVLVFDDLPEGVFVEDLVALEALDVAALIVQLLAVAALAAHRP